MGITQSMQTLGASSTSGGNVTKNILEYVMGHIVEFKKLNQDRPPDFGAGFQDDQNQLVLQKEMYFINYRQEKSYWS